MTLIADSVSTDQFSGGNSAAIETRVFFAMFVTVGLAVMASAILAPWRVTGGLLLGGLLALLNYHWLRTSVAAVFNVNISSERPQAKASRYILRYFVIGVISFAAYKLRLVSLPAMLAGLCAFVPALFFEAGRQFYFAIVHREEYF
jgi:hypothetical protein